MENIIAQIRQKAEVLLKEKKRIIIAIDGSCTAGKSTLAEALTKEFECSLFHMDDFFLRPEQRTLHRLAQTGGNVDYERFWEEVLQPLGAGKTVSYRPYDCTAACLKEPVEVKSRPISLVEGSYSHHPYFGDAYDLRVFLMVSPEIRERRLKQRPAFLQKRFREEWIPMEQRYFSEFEIAPKADLVAMPADNQ